MAKSAIERLNQKKEKKKVILETDFAGVRAGQLMLVGTPKMIDAYIKSVPTGKTKTMRQLRNELARRHRYDATCPVSTAIFVRLVAQAAIEEMDSGKSPRDVTPFWRVVAPDDKIAGKLNIDREWIGHQRELEQC